MTQDESRDEFSLTTVGIDIGSSTSHIVFSRVRFRRLGTLLSSRFGVVGREVLWQSKIQMTPYAPNGLIDPVALKLFVQDCYVAAGLDQADVDSGAVILTGTALKRRNARSISEAVADETGRFVCISAGPHLEAQLGVLGSGAAIVSRGIDARILHLDVGGGTTKLSVVEGGEVIASAAIAVGARLVAFDEARRIVRFEDAAREAARALDVEMGLGKPLAPDDQAGLVHLLAGIVIDASLGRVQSELARRLMLTEPLPVNTAFEAMTCSGGVAEYVYGRENGQFGDLGRSLAEEIRRATESGDLPRPLLEPKEGIRATVIGASQFTVQVSGSTISLSDADLLPIHNLPVSLLPLKLATNPDSRAIASAIRTTLARDHLEGRASGLALAIRWSGSPVYERLRAVAQGIAHGLRGLVPETSPIVLVFDADVSYLVGEIIRRELDLRIHLFALDGLQLTDFDFVDIGEPLQPAGVVPVVIKSLLFPV